MTGKKPLIVFGTGEIGRLARYYFDHDSDYQVIAFTADDEFFELSDVEDLPIIPFSQLPEAHPPGTVAVHVALSYRGLNRNRRAAFERVRDAGYSFASYVCSKSVTWPDLSIGENCFILENQTIQPTVSIGNNVIIWSGNHLGHGCHIDDHVYIASHAVMSGHSKIGQRTFVGVNATIRDYANVGTDCFIAMDASITGDVPDGAVVIGTGGTIYPADDRRAKTLKRRYFGPFV